MNDNNLETSHLWQYDHVSSYFVSFVFPTATSILLLFTSNFGSTILSLTDNTTDEQEHVNLVSTPLKSLNPMTKEHGFISHVSPLLTSLSNNIYIPAFVTLHLGVAFQQQEKNLTFNVLHCYSATVLLKSILSILSIILLTSYQRIYQYR